MLCPVSKGEEAESRTAGAHLSLCKDAKPGSSQKSCFHSSTLERVVAGY